MLDEAPYRRRPADVGRFIERNGREGPPDLLPGDAQRKRRMQRDGGREVGARLGVALAERRRHVQRLGVIRAAEPERDPAASAPRLVPSAGLKVRPGPDLPQVLDAGWSYGLHTSGRCA